MVFIEQTQYYNSAMTLIKSLLSVFIIILLTFLQHTMCYWSWQTGNIVLPGSALSQAWSPDGTLCRHLHLEIIQELFPKGPLSLIFQKLFALMMRHCHLSSAKFFSDNMFLSSTPQAIFFSYDRKAPSPRSNKLTLIIWML